MSNPQNSRIAGRGSGNRDVGRFERISYQIDVESVDDPEFFESLSDKVPTEYLEDRSESVVSENSSPDIPFRYSLNPYRGCAHGCSYCYARPTHEFLGFGVGLDFETKVVVKPDAPKLFRKWMTDGFRSGRKVEPVMLSGVTDCYQPIERSLKLTRQCLKLALEFRHPVQVITKNGLIRRDLDLLRELTKLDLVKVAISLTSLAQDLVRTMEPRTSSPKARLDAIHQLSSAGIPTMVMIAPVVPAINDEEIPALIKAAADAGATRVGYVMLRLPLSVETVFLGWLDQHFPDRKEKVIERIRSMRSGKLNSSTYGQRMTGTGIWAEQIRMMISTFSKQHGMTFGASYEASRKGDPLRTDLFRMVDEKGATQKKLF